MTCETGVVPVVDLSLVADHREEIVFIQGVGPGIAEIAAVRQQLSGKDLGI